jgi:hypothetical protein
MSAGSKYIFHTHNGLYCDAVIEGESVFRDDQSGLIQMMDSERSFSRITDSRGRIENINMRRTYSEGLIESFDRGTMKWGFCVPT